MGTKLVIWEDLPGRQLLYPDPDTPLYYNPEGGKNYHAAEACYGVRDEYEPMTMFTYGELGTGNYSSLTACPYCVPPRTIEEIDAINEAHKLP